MKETHFNSMLLPNKVTKGKKTNLICRVWIHVTCLRGLNVVQGAKTEFQPFHVGIQRLASG